MNNNTTSTANKSSSISNANSCVRGGKECQTLGLGSNATITASSTTTANTTGTTTTLCPFPFAREHASTFQRDEQDIVTVQRMALKEKKRGQH